MNIFSQPQVEESTAGVTIGEEHFPDASTLLERARALVNRGAPFTQSESAIIGATWPHIQNRPVADALDVLLVPAAHRFHRFRAHVPTPAIATPFDAKIAVAGARMDETRAMYDAALDAVHTLTDKVRRASSRGEDTTGLTQELRDAEANLQVADAVWLRVRSGLTALELAASRYRTEQTCMMIGADGVPVKLADFGRA